MCIALYCVSMQQPSFKELEKRDVSTQTVENTVEATRQDGTTEVVCWDWVHHVMSLWEGRNTRDRLVSQKNCMYT